MLHELRVENLLLIERAELRLDSGLNIISGETGAGKTVLAHAIDLLLGGKPRSGIVRPGAAEAYVEGVFTRPGDLSNDLSDLMPPDADEIVLARRVTSQGRSRAYICGRSASAPDLRALGEKLLSFYGQHEHRKLMLASSQLEILDSFCGPAQQKRRSDLLVTYSKLRALQASRRELADQSADRERELDLLRWELAEIEEVAPTEAEEQKLSEQRDRLRHGEKLALSTTTASALLAGDDGETGVSTALAHATAALDDVQGLDQNLDKLRERVGSVALELDDIISELSQYEVGVDGEKVTLDDVELRLSAFDRLKRKHGGDIPAVLAHAEQARQRIADMSDVSGALERIDREIADVAQQADTQVNALRKARKAAVTKLEHSVLERLTQLAMDGASFTIELTDCELGPTGADDVEFMLKANKGVPAQPLRDTASGGELSRVMLALLSSAAQAGPASLVFDEVDAGIGGKTACAVGEQLQTLAVDKQVICITHLPQIAALANRHFTISKDPTSEPARTTVTQLVDGAIVGELVRMLGANDDDAAARRHAQELLKAA